MPAWLYPLCVFTISTSLAAHVAIQHAELDVERERRATQLGALRRLVGQARDGADGRSARVTAEQVNRELALVGLRDRPGVVKAGAASGVSWMDVLRPSKRAERTAKSGAPAAVASKLTLCSSGVYHSTCRLRPSASRPTYHRRASERCSASRRNFNINVHAARDRPPGIALEVVTAASTSDWHVGTPSKDRGDPSGPSLPTARAPCIFLSSVRRRLGIDQLVV